MKKYALFYLAICLLVWNPGAGQKSGLLNKVSKSVSNEITGKSEKPDNVNAEPEPSCASDQAVIAMDLGGKLQLDYKELSFSILSDGRILSQAHGSDEYYVSKDGVTAGPYKAGDPQIADFVPKEDNEKGEADLVQKYKPYVTKSGDKYIITFGGKKYGPYARIDNFTVSKSRDKFAAFATENVVLNENQGKKMEEAMKNARDDQERMELAMEYAQLMQENMGQGGDPTSITAKLVSNIPNVNYDPVKIVNPILNSEVKFDDILFTTYDNKIYNLQGKLLFTMKEEAMGAKNLFVNSNNSKYAFYNSGTLTFSDNTTLAELFNPQMVKLEGKVYLSYMYYSPKKNAIMQHKIPF